MLKYEIRRLSAESIDDQVKVYIDSFEHYESSFEFIKKRWEIKHFKNPIGKSYIFGAFDNHTLVGINCFLQMKYQFGDDVIKVLQSCESGVLKSYRRKGIWGQIMSYAKQYLSDNTDNAAIIGFPNYVNSYPGFVKMGWKTIFNEKNMLFICNGNMALEMYLGKHWWTVFGKILNIQAFKLRKSPVEGKIDISERLSLDDLEFNDKKQMQLFINQEWIDWKAKYEGLKVFHVVKEGKTIGTIIGKIEQKNEIPYFQMYSIKGENIYLAFSSFYRYLLKDSISLIRGWCKYDSKYKGLGFIEMNKHLNPFIITTLNKDFDWILGENIWNPNFLDLD